MDFYRIVGSECGRDRYGDFECVCGYCEKLPEGSTHDEVVGHPAHLDGRKVNDLTGRVEKLEQKAKFARQMSELEERRMGAIEKMLIIESIGVLILIMVFILALTAMT